MPPPRGAVFPLTMVPLRLTVPTATGGPGLRMLAIPPPPPDGDPRPLADPVRRVQGGVRLVSPPRRAGEEGPAGRHRHALVLGMVAGGESELVGRAGVPGLAQRLGKQARWQRPLDLDVGALHLGLEGVELAAEYLAGAGVAAPRLADLLARAAQADLKRDQDLNLLRLGDGSRVVQQGEVAAHDRAVQVEGARLRPVASQRVGILGQSAHAEL